MSATLNKGQMDGFSQKELFLIRHAESTHNSYAYKEGHGEDVEIDPLHWDATLSEKGFEQAAELAKKIQDLQVDVVIVSPLSRALVTCLESFGKVHPRIPIIVHPLCRERLENACDVGTPLSQLQIQMKEKYLEANLDFSLIKEEFWWFLPDKVQGKLNLTNYKEEFLNQRQKFQEPFELVRTRISNFKLWLLNQNQYHRVAVISHSAFLKEFLNSKEKMPNCHIEPMILSSESKYPSEN